MLTLKIAMLVAGAIAAAAGGSRALDCGLNGRCAKAACIVAASGTALAIFAAGGLIL